VTYRLTMMKPLTLRNLALSTALFFALVVTASDALAELSAPPRGASSPRMVPTRAVKELFRARGLVLVQSPLSSHPVSLYFHFPAGRTVNDFEVGVFSSSEAASRYALPLTRPHARVLNVVLLLGRGVRPDVRAAAIAVMVEMRRRFS
jgi:hypothetical protein